MSTVKANHYLGVLDAARCNSEWDAIPEWSRKVQKHAPGRKCTLYFSPCSSLGECVYAHDADSVGLALTASTEAKLYRLPHLGLESTPAAIAAYHVSLTDLQTHLQTELETHSNVTNLPSPAGGTHSMGVTSDDVLQARTILSWIYSLKGDWGAALRVVPGEEEVGEGWAGNGGKGDYIGVIRIKALVLKGIALAHMNPDDPSLPLQLYRAATKLPSTYTPEQQTSTSFLLWTEKALSHNALAAYRCWLDNHIPRGNWDGGQDTLETGEEEEEAQEVGMAVGRTTIDEASVARAFREFHQFVAGLSSAAPVQVGTAPAIAESGLTPEKELERREVYRNYVKFISLLLLPEGHPNRPIPRKLPSFKPVAGSTVSVVATNSPTGIMAPKAGTTDALRVELKAVEHVYEEYLLRGLNFPRAVEYHEVIGEWVDLVVENWRVAGGSGEEAPTVVEILYRSATKTFHSPRILRHLFTTLTATGNFPDAVRSLDTYIDLVQRAKDRISKGHIEKDFDDDKTILETAVEGIRVLCGLVDDGRKGMDLAERIEMWIDEWRVREDDVLAAVYRGIGTANATWARKTVDGESRPDIQRAAIKAFEKALIHDQFDIDAWYGLSLVQIEVGDIDSAIESAKRGLVIVRYLSDEESEEAWDGRRDYKRRTVPLLHLLSLLMTVAEEFEDARRACANVFEILGEDMAVFRGMGIGEKESVLEVRMTQIAIEEALDGAGAAVKMTDHLLDMYGRLFEAAQLDHGSRSMYENGQLDISPFTQPITTHRKSRLLGGRRKSTFSTTVSSLPPGGLTGESGSIARPKSGHQSLHQPTGLGSGPGAPQIQVIDVHGGASQTDYVPKKAGRPSSVSSGTMRRMKSFSSMRSGKGDHGRIPIPDVPTPPLPSGTNTSSVSVERSPAGSIKEHHHHNTHLFQVLKSKLHKHQLQEMGGSGTFSEPLPQFGSTLSFMTNDSSITPMDSTAEGHTGREAPRAEDIPNNLSQSKLPYPIRALGSGITDEIGKDAKPRSIRRPKQLPEPKLQEEDEKRRALAALRKIWIFVGGLARRSKDFGGAAFALDEASTLIGPKGEGEADVLTERAFLATEEGKRNLAIEYFNAAIAVDVNHPLAIVGICQLLLEIPATVALMPVTAPTSDVAEIETRPSTPASSTAPKSPINSVSEDESYVSSLAANNRALGLLEHLTNSSYGWDIPEAWFALARAYELGGEIGRAKRSLWRCVELEDARAVRAWCNIKPRVL